jgi:hypothetical protein
MCHAHWRQTTWSAAWRTRAHRCPAHNSTNTRRVELGCKTSMLGLWLLCSNTYLGHIQRQRLTEKPGDAHCTPPVRPALKSSFRPNVNNRAAARDGRADVYQLRCPATYLQPPVHGPQHGPPLTQNGGARISVPNHTLIQPHSVSQRHWYNQPHSASGSPLSPGHTCHDCAPSQDVPSHCMASPPGASSSTHLQPPFMAHIMVHQLDIHNSW